MAPARGADRPGRAKRVELGVGQAARWARALLRGIGWYRQAWVCPEEPPVLAARLLAAATDRSQGGSFAAAVDGPVRRMKLFVDSFAIERIGQLVVDGGDIRIGRAEADCELHVLFGDLTQAEGIRRRLVQTAHEGWLLYGKFTAEGESDWVFAVLAIRQGGSRFMLYDQSFVKADDDLRQWAARALRRQLTVGVALAQDDASGRDTASLLVGTLGADRSRIWATAGRRDALHPHVDAAPKVAFYVGSMAIVGGLERWVISMIGALRDIGVNAFVLALVDGQPADELQGQLKGRFLSLEGNASRLADVIADGEFDVLLLNHVYDGVDAVASRVLCFEVLHNIYFWQKDDRGLAEMRRRLCGLISISPVVTEYSSQFLSVPRDAITEIPHGFDPVGFIRPIGHLTQGDECPRPMRFLQVANLYPQKNTLALVMGFHQAFAGDGNYRLDIVGGLCHSPLTDAVDDFIEANALGSQIRLLGSVDRHAMSRLYAQSNVFCFPSLHEGYGLAMLEAMYYALPLVVSNTGNAVQLVSHNNGIVVPLAVELEATDANAVEQKALAPSSADVTALSDALVRMATGYPAYKEGAKAAAATFSQTMAIGKTARSYAALFRRSVKS